MFIFYRFKCQSRLGNELGAGASGTAVKDALEAGPASEWLFNSRDWDLRGYDLYKWAFYSFMQANVELNRRVLVFVVKCRTAQAWLHVISL